MAHPALPVKLNDIVAVKFKMKLFSYVVARDYGFAPNPFFGICTLATCKPKIRETASHGDWIIGTGSKVRGRQGHLVFAMRVSETFTFNDYWFDERFLNKRPNLQGSLKQAFGDNIYFQDENGCWNQRNSHHSYENGVPNIHNIERDTQANRVLAGVDFVYWGGSGPQIDPAFRDYKDYDVCAGHGHRCRFPVSLVQDFIEWLHSLDQHGYIGEPLDWHKPMV